MPRSLVALPALLLALLLAPAAAQAQTAVGGEIDEAAQALQATPVHVDPDADPKPSDTGALIGRIQRADAGPVYVAVLSERAVEESGGSPDAALQALYERTRRRGTYILVAGTTLRAGSDLFNGVGDLASDVTRENRGEGIDAVLASLIDRVGEARQGGGATGRSRGTGGGGGGGGFLIILGVLAAAVGALSLASKRRRRKAEAAELVEVKENVRDDLVALGDDIRALDIDMELDTTPQPAKEAYAVALAAYERAETGWERARRAEDLEPVGASLEEGRYAMLSAKAVMEGREPPERRPPCFFDPRHGPSDRDVEWSPPFGETRLVPACEADAQRVERGDEPATRELVVGGSRMPYYNAGAAYAPFTGGYYGGFGGGLLPGLLMGSMLGGGLGMGMGMGLGSGMAYGSSGGFDSGGFGSGGGDFGGGGGGFDFGGGDFGGGGGDFGGGGGDF